MNRRNYFRMTVKSLIFSAAFLMFGAMTSFAASKNGCIDGVANGQIYGWAWDPATPSDAINVHVIISDASAENETEAEVVWFGDATADQFREDLATGNIGDGNHAWTIDIDESLFQQDVTYYINLYNGEDQIGRTLSYLNGSYEFLREVSDAEAVRDGLVALGTFKTTAYCPCYGCSEGWGRNTSSGAMATSNHTIAVDPRVIPYGTKLLIDGVIYTAEDMGGGVKGNHIDIFFDAHSETTQYGVRYAEVYMLS